MAIIYIRDTVSSMNDLSLLLGKDYSELFAYIQEKKLDARKVMAFYRSSQTPFVVDVAVETDKWPMQTSGRIHINKIKGGNAIVAHYTGPYNQSGAAYKAIHKWLGQHNKTAEGVPFEVYLNSPATVTDPYDLRTDVYQFIK
ncbi:MAG: GyrI-like domain-containing protein [Bacteroidetes bacterium]|nr:GyrI-like domain-containing protein [Bacteroidota bacterium]